ncbi:MAG: hypothetical protein PWP08_881 [Methanofollis sp.]|nr:hypothetical protein [Methanofollis sp.]
MSGQHLAEAIAREWAEALGASTYFRVLQRDGCSHDEFWRSFPDYDALMARCGYPGAVAGRLCALVPPGSTVLDIGAGTGAFTLPLARTAASVVALDPSSYHLGVLRQKAASAGIANLRYVEAVWGEAAASAVGPADYAVAAYSMIDPDLRGFLAAMIRCAKKGVFLVYRAGDPDPLNAFVRGEHRPIDYLYIERMLGAMGYEPDVAFFRRGYLLPVDAVLERYRDGRRDAGEIRAFLSASGRIESSPSGEAVRCTTTDALVSVRTGRE